MGVSNLRRVQDGRIGTGNDTWLMTASGDPTTGIGAPGGVGSWLVTTDNIYQKTGTGATDWTPLGSLPFVSVPASSVTAGTFGSGDYVFPANLAVTTALRVGTYLSADTAPVVVEGSSAGSAWYRTANGPTISLFRVNNTMAAPSAVLSGETIGVMTFGGYGGTTFNNSSAQLIGTAAENFTSTNFGGNLLIRQKPTGGGTFRTTWTFGANGSLTGSETGASRELILDVTGTGGTDFVTYVGRFTRTGPAAVQNNDMLVRIVGRGYDGSAMSGSRVELQMQAAGTWTGSSHPTKITFATTPSGATADVQRWTITEAGNLIANTDNALDFGASGANRPRTGYFGTSVVVGTDPGGTSPLRIGGSAVFSGSITVAGTFTGQFGLTVTSSVTASSATARGLNVATALIAAANGDTLTGARVSPGFTPGSFTGLLTRGLTLEGWSVAGFSSPGDPILLNLSNTQITGTGAANAYSIKFGAGPSDATNNYLLHATNFNVTSAGAGTFGTSVVVGTDWTGLSDMMRVGGAAVFGQPSGTATAVRIVSLHDTAASASQLQLRRARTGPAAVQSGDVLGYLTGLGYDSSAYVTGAEIRFVAAETFSGTARGTTLRFYTTPATTTTLTEQWRVTSSGVWQPGGDNLNDIGLTGTRVKAFYAYTGDFKTTIGVGVGLTTDNLNATMTVNAGDHSGANDKDAYYGVQRGGTSLWRMGVLGSVSADANWTLRDVVNGSSAIVITPSTLAAVFGGSIKTATPSGGTAAAWKFGSLLTGGAYTADLTKAVELDIGGTLVKLGVVT